MDFKTIAQDIYELSESNPQVKEALEVIDQSLDTHGYDLLSTLNIIAELSYIFKAGQCRH
jgi:hypothetical protein